MPTNMIQTQESGPPIEQSVVLFSPALTADEQAVLYGLLGQSRSVEDIVPDDTDPETLWSYLSASCKAMMRMRELSAQLKPIIGRILVLAEKYPELYRGQMGANTQTGQPVLMKNFDDFIAFGIPAAAGVSRAEAYHAKKIAKRFPSLDTKTYGEIGNIKMTLLVKEKTETDSDAAQWVEMAKNPNVSVDRFREMVANKTLADPASLELVNVVITMTKEIRKKWQAFLRNSLVQEYCGTESPGEILGILMAECELEWAAAAQLNRGGQPQMPEIGE